MTRKPKRLGRGRRTHERRAPRFEPLELRLALTCSVGENCPPDLDLSSVAVQTVTAGEPVTLDFSGLVTDVDDQGTPTGDIITFRLDPDAPALDGAPSGATITPDGMFTWTPTNMQQGTHVITVIAIDQGTPRRADAETFTVVVEPGNDPPVAEDDTFATDEDTPITSGNLLDDNGNGADSDPNGDPITVSGSDTTSAFGAAVSVNSDGTFTYDPTSSSVIQALAEGETDFDTFSYTISDGNGGVDTATVSIALTGVNDDPTANDDDAAADEDGPAVVIDVTANDSDPDVDLIAPDDVLTIASVSQGANGGLVTTDNSTVTYDPNGAFESLAEGETATDTFTYTVSDGNGGTAQATVTVTITGQNDDPDALDDENEVTPLNTPITIDVLANDSDVDGDAISVSAVTNGSNGTVSNNSTDVTYTPNGGFEGTDTFTYTITDGNGGTAMATVTVVVGGNNLPPTATPDEYSTDEDSEISGNVISDDTGNGSDSDPNVTDMLVVSEVNGDAGDVDTLITLPSGSSLQVDANGGFTYNPGTSATYNALAVNETATDTFTYTISDGNGGTDTATVTIFLTGVNDAPTATDNDYAGSVAANITGNLISDDTGDGSDSDPDTGDTLSISEVDGSAGNVDTLLTLASGATLVVNPNGTMTVNTGTANVAPGAMVTDTFTYTVSDGNGGADQATVSIVINGGAVNQPPVAVDDDVDETDEDTPFTTANVLANDSDPENDALSIDSFDATGTIGLVTDNGDGTFDYDPNGQFESLAVGQTDTDAFSYTISDGNGGTDSATVTITITGVNDDPSATPNEYNGSVEEAITGNVITDDTGDGSDSDIDAGDVLMVSEVNGAAGNVDNAVTLNSGAMVTVGSDGTMTVDTSTAMIDPNTTATDTFTYTISDGNGGSDTATVTIMIAGPGNTPPVAEDDFFETDEDTAISGQNVMADNGSGADSDADADLLAVSELNGVAGDVGQPILLPSGATLTLESDGAFSYDPTTSVAFNALAVAESATDSFQYTLSDGRGGLDTATVTIIVNGVNDDPTALDDGGPGEEITTDEETEVVITVLGNDTDPDTNDTLDVTLVSDPANGVAVINGDNTISYTPNENFSSDTDTFTYTISDGNGGTDTATVTVFVNNLNDAPNLAPIDDQNAEVGVELVVTVTATDPDPFDALDYQPDDNFPAGATITKINNNTAEIRWTPAAQDAGQVFTFTVIVLDSGNPVEGDTETFNVTVAANNVEPQLDLNGAAAGADSTETFSRGGGAVPIVAASGLTVLPGQVATIQSAMATITNRGDGANESLSVNVGATGIAANYDPGTGVLTLTGENTPENYQLVLRTLVYNNTAADPVRTDRAVEVKVNDGANDSNTATATVGIRALFIDLNGGGQGVNFAGSFLVGQDPVPMVGTTDAGGLTINAPAGRNIVSASIVITDPLDGANEVLAVDTSGTSIVASYDVGTHTLTLTGSASVLNYTSVMRTLTYENQSATPNNSAARHINVTINDGGGDSNVGVSTIDIVNLVLDLNGAAPGINFTNASVAGAGPVAITAADVDVTFVGGNMLAAAVLVLDSPTALLDENITFDTDGTNITGDYDAVSGQVLFQGLDTIENYEQVLASLRYEDRTSTADPTVSIGDHFVAPLNSFAVPVVVNNIPGATGIDLTITYDATKFTINAGGIATGTATSGWSITTNLGTPGIIALNLFNTDPLGTRRIDAVVSPDGVAFSPLAASSISGVGSGSILNLTFSARLGQSGSGDLAITQARVNEGNIAVTTSDGSLTIGVAPAPPANDPSDGALSGQLLMGVSDAAYETLEAILGEEGEVLVLAAPLPDANDLSNSDDNTDAAFAAGDSDGVDPSDGLDELLEAIASDVLDGYGEV